jgi:MFS family permease
VKALLLDDRFRTYAMAKLLQLAGQNALIYGLFILVIQKQQSSLSTSLFILCSIVPSVLLSIPGGATVDAVPRKPMILLGLVLRMLIIAAFIQGGLGLPLVLILTVLVWSVYQFYSPAEVAALPAVTPPGYLTQANAVIYVVSLLAQFGGAGFIAPVALKTFDASGLFVVTLVLVFAGAWLYLTLPDLTPPGAVARREGLRASLTGGLRFFRRDALSARAMLQFVVLGSATSMVLVAIPEYLEDILRTSVLNAVYIFSPGAIGIAFGLAVAPLLTRLVGGATVTFIGFVAFSAVLGALGAIVPITARLEGWEYFAWARDQFHISPRIATAMLIVPFGGLGIALVNVASRALLYERARPDQLGQLFATQSAIGSVASILPTLLAGVLVDRVDVRFFLGGIAVFMVASLIPLLRYGRSVAHVPATALVQEYPSVARSPRGAGGAR